MNLLLLLLVPPQELCRAEWRNIDPVAGEWTIPATAATSGRGHIVPLAPATIDLLTVQWQATGTGRWGLKKSPGGERAIHAALRATGRTATIMGNRINTAEDVARALPDAARFRLTAGRLLARQAVSDFRSDHSI
jgi:integrase